MKITLTTLLTKPGQFFENFQTLPPKWIVAYLGYFLVSFVGTTGNLSYLEKAISPLLILLLSFIGALVGALFCRYFYGVLWMYLGSKIFGGRALKSEIVQGVGYAFLFPGLLSLLAVPLYLLTAYLGAETTMGIVLTCLNLPLLLLLSVVSLVYSAFAVKQLNGFGWIKTLGVIAWFPLALLLIVGIGAVVKMIIT